MATIGTLTNYADVRKQTDPNDLVSRMIEMMAQENEILNDIPFMETNKTDTHKAALRTGLPSVIWRSFNQGIPSSKSSKTFVEFTCGQAAGRSEVDKDLADLGGNPMEYRMSEAKAFIEAMGQEMTNKFFYGNEAFDPETLTGIARYYSASSGAASGDNVVLHGGAGADNTSAYIVGWGEDTIHGIYPKGSSAGLKHDNKGIVELRDENNDPYDGYADVFSWKAGLALKDWRYGGRLANVDVSDIKNGSSLDPLKALVRNLIILTERVKGGSNRVIYVNQTLRTAVRLSILEKVSGNFTWETVEGKRVEMFDGIPIRLVDGILNTESLVS